jgi:YHS domain-containing protein
VEEPVINESQFRPRAEPEREATDPVCGMRVAITPATASLLRDGKIFYFCSPGCRDDFAAAGEGLIPGARQTT